MRKLFFFSFIVLVFNFCSSEVEPEIPDYVISREKIIPVIIDMHIADATLMTLQLDNKENKYRSDFYYEQIFTKHNITKSDFDTSIMFYSRIPDYYNKIYDDVLAELNKMSGELSQTDTIPVDTIIYR
ncbi:MAG: DUF4296 domain-containing protein [Bacteroidota bacterium]